MPDSSTKPPVPKVYLHIITILEAIEKIQLYTKGCSSASDLFTREDQLHFNAALNLLIAVGEEVNKLPSDLRTEYLGKSWKSIVGLRNELSHNYRGVDPDLIWDIVINHISPLKESITQMYSSLEPLPQIEQLIQTDFYRHISYLLPDKRKK